MYKWRTVSKNIIRNTEIKIRLRGEIADQSPKLSRISIPISLHGITKGKPRELSEHTRRAMSVVPRISIPSRTFALGASWFGGGGRGGWILADRLTRVSRTTRGWYITTNYPLGLPPLALLPPSPRFSSLLSLCRALLSSSFQPPTAPFPSEPGGGSSNHPSSLLSLLPYPCAHPASFIRRKIHLHNGPHAHRLLTRSIRIVYMPSWKLTNSPTWPTTHMYYIYVYTYTYICIYIYVYTYISWLSQISNTYQRRVS